MRNSYLDYAMSVIVRRALPDAPGRTQAENVGACSSRCASCPMTGTGPTKEVGPYRRRCDR